MNALTFQIRTLEPLLVTQLGTGEENSATAFDFIPGSVVRGAVISLYLQQHPVSDAAQDPVCRGLFFDGNVRYLNAYPVNRLGERTLPKPLSWRVSKDERDSPSATIYDFAIEWNGDVEGPVSPSGTFCWQDDDRVEFIKPARHVGVHNASENRNVKRKGESTVFRYEAIATGEKFGAVILSDSKDDLETLHSLLNEVKVDLGGSRSAGYGRVCFEDVQVITNWQEYETNDEPDEAILVLTLLSDAILRNRHGQPTTDLDEALGCRHLRAYQRTRVVGGFNRKWGLPLVQTPALQAGSVFVYPASSIDEEMLERLVKEGIGERRAEGFGRIAVNWHTRAMWQGREVLETITYETVSLSEESHVLAKRMAERRLRAVLDRKLLEALGRLRIDSPPSNAQLSRLRSVVRRLWQESTPNLVENIPKHVAKHLDNFLDNLKKDARAQFRRARIGSRSLESWLREGVGQNGLWQHLQPSDELSIAGVPAEITDAIRTEYTMRQLDALLQRTIREQ